jgi:hypothetical protein
MIDWDKEAKLMLKAELARRGISYKVLVVKLVQLGVIETEGAIANKISRGKFSMAFFLQCMNAVGVSDISVAVDSSENAGTDKP